MARATASTAHWMEKRSCCYCAEGARRLNRQILHKPNSCGPTTNDGENLRRSRKYHTKLMDDLQDPAEAAAYLDEALEAGDREAFLLAVKHVAEARGGMSQLAKTAALNREHLYRMLSKDGNPEIQSLATVLQALGLRLSIEAA